MILVTGIPGFIAERLLPRLLELTPDPSFGCLVKEVLVDLAHTHRGQVRREAMA